MSPKEIIQAITKMDKPMLKQSLVDKRNAEADKNMDKLVEKIMLDISIKSHIEETDDCYNNIHETKNKS